MPRFFSFVIFFLVSSAAGANSCLTKSGAVDFGSGTTKFIVVSVDTCKKTIEKVLVEDRIQLSLNEYLERSADGRVELKYLDEVMPRIQHSLQRMRDAGVEKPLAVATSVFRVAKNGAEMAQYISKKLNLEIHIISQEREAELGYYSALSKLKNKPDNLIVWDIGGGSMQMYTKTAKKTYVYEGNLASVTFKNKVVRDTKFSDPKNVTSPNPIGFFRGAVVQMAKNHAYLDVPTYFKSTARQATVVGVGGVLAMSVQRQAKEGAATFSVDELEQAYNERSHLTDAEIDSRYRTTDITNLALVLGYMKALQIQEVQTVEAALGEGLIYENLTL